MSGKKKLDPNKTQQEEIATMKKEVIRIFTLTGVRTASINYVGRDVNTLLDWEAKDQDFREEMRKAKSQFLMHNRHKVKLDNVFAHLFDEGDRGRPHYQRCPQPRRRQPSP